MRTLKISYNSPVILTFTLLAGLSFLVDFLSGQMLVKPIFAANPYFSFLSPVSWIRLFSYIFVHQDWPHLSANFLLILLLGPLLEEKYGSSMLLGMIIITALATSIINILLFNVGMIGASGVVFLFIVLSSFAAVECEGIPMTFILVGAVFFGNEVINSFAKDNVAQFAHILGGVCGSCFGFMLNRDRGL